MSARAINQKTAIQTEYSTFNQLDGSHPWMTALPTGYVSYRVRTLNHGQITYFNFALAKEMGLISSRHNHRMNPELEQKLLETFSIQIINEYDELSKRRIPTETIKPNLYMATRYLQLQHHNKQGKTSGDGRGIWNGIVKNRGSVWDVSSRGTGVTCLAPGAVTANRPLKTGAAEFGYGCGQAEIDELIGSAIAAETMHLQGINTERVLCIIDLGKGVGIGVRAAKNLIRPAHLFLYLKQNRYEDLKKSFDFLIDRQVQNKKWSISQSPQKYTQALEHIGRDFADFTAKLDVDYIFAWLDWDGDNVLADAGIIDYGSIRQFGIRHDRYRYDDVERFSTNLNEQRRKARQIVQVFAQIADYLKTKQKKPFKYFAKDPVVVKFNQQFAQARAHRILYRMGFNPQQREKILKDFKTQFENFDAIFSKLERAKVSSKPEKVADGVNHPALYNMRAFLREYPQFLQTALKHEENPLWNSKDLYKNIRSSFAKRKDFSPKEKQIKNLQLLQSTYKELLFKLIGKKAPPAAMEAFVKRAIKLNSDNRITGNALVEIVDEMIVSKKRGLERRSFQSMIDRIVSNYLHLPEIEANKYLKSLGRPSSVQPELYARILNILKERKEDI